MVFAFRRGSDQIGRVAVEVFLRLGRACGEIVGIVCRCATGSTPGPRCIRFRYETKICGDFFCVKEEL